MTPASQSPEVNPLRAPFYADQAQLCRATIVYNRGLARDTYCVRLDCPEIASRILPGQFVMLRLPDRDDPLLGRALALYDTFDDESGNPRGIDLVYLVVGKMTARLAECRPDQHVDLWGPLGNGFAPPRRSHLIMVAGGIGQTPFVAVAAAAQGLRQYGTGPPPAARAEHVTLCYGVRTRDLLAGVSDFERYGVDVRIASDDGSAGHPGLVTEILRQALDDSQLPCEVVCCGPEPMMAAVSEICLADNIPCQVSLETPMACGIGICFSCVARVKQRDGSWDYKRTCVEGPIFDAAQIEW